MKLNIPQNTKRILKSGSNPPMESGNLTSYVDQRLIKVQYESQNVKDMISELSRNFLLGDSRCSPEISADEKEIDILWIESFVYTLESIWNSDEFTREHYKKCFYSLAKCLSILNSHGVICYDLSPTNILVDTTLDRGFFLSVSQSVIDRTNQQSLDKYPRVGNLKFRAPEINLLMDGEIDVPYTSKSVVYSFGLNILSTLIHRYGIPEFKDQDSIIRSSDNFGAYSDLINFFKFIRHNFCHLFFA